ncbi:protein DETOXIFICATION 12 isoform X2 [Arachis hypogaea]|uniref:protein DETOXIFICATION 12 isoform X2 n=1 Tax=Arachis hypogaea TaxID=3818 RepID=UPI003B21A54D
MKFSTQCEMTCAPISMELFHDFGEFLCYTVPSAGMIYLEWWSFELLTLPSELLPNPELEVSFLSIWTGSIGSSTDPPVEPVIHQLNQ